MAFVNQELGDLPENWQPSPDDFKRYIGKAILFRDIQRIVREDESITAYRINVTTYTVSLLAEKTVRRIDLDAIWKQQRISDVLAETARLWAPVVFKALLEYSQQQTVHIDNILKSQAAWEHMLSLNLRLPASVERELVSSTVPAGGTSGGRGAQVTSDEFSTQDHNNAARCMELGADQWLAIVSWGNGPGELEKWQLGIATTLASYAAQGWAKTPSQKQAKHGALMIAAARAGGISNC